MTVYSYVYLFLTLIVLIHIIRNKFDLLSVCALCYIIYTIYCIPGIGIAGLYRPNLSPDLYYFVYTQLVIILTYLIIQRRKEKKLLEFSKPDINEKPIAIKGKDKKLLDYSFYAYTAVIFCFATINIISIGFSGFASGKANVWEQANIFYTISLYGAFVSFAYGIHNKKKFIWMTALFIELTIFFAGSRAFTNTMLVFFLVEYGNSLWNKSKYKPKAHNNRWGLYILGGLLLVFMLIYRAVDKTIMSGNYVNIMQILSSAETWLKAFEFNEPRVIIANYDYVIAYNFRLPFGDVIYRIIDFVPGLTRLIPIKLEYPDHFSTWLMFEEKASGGVGGTIWGESYAMFGTLGIIIATFIWLKLISACNKHFNYFGGHSYFLVSLGTYLSWYISRLDYNRVGQACKVTLLCFLIWSVFYLLLGGKVKVFGIAIKFNIRWL